MMLIISPLRTTFTQIFLSDLHSSLDIFIQNNTHSISSSIFTDLKLPKAISQLSRLTALPLCLLDAHNVDLPPLHKIHDLFSSASHAYYVQGGNSDGRSFLFVVSLPSSLRCLLQPYPLVIREPYI